MLWSCYDFDMFLFKKEKGGLFCHSLSRQIYDIINHFIAYSKNIVMSVWFWPDFVKNRRVECKKKDMVMKVAWLRRDFMKKVCWVLKKVIMKVESDISPLSNQTCISISFSLYFRRFQDTFIIASPLCYFNEFCH